MVWGSLYFYYFPYWKPLLTFAISMQCFVIIGSLFIPESPVALYENGRYQEARNVYSKIAQRNNTRNYEIDYKFDKELKEK